MKESERIEKLFRDLFDGDPWLDSSLIGTLSTISAEKAARKPQKLQNSIWEIANHVTKWREVVLDRVKGAPKYSPEHNYFLPVEDTSEAAWKLALHELEKSQQSWLDYLGTVSEEKMSQRYFDSDYTIYDLIFGIMQHDAYHLGQLNLLAKYDL